jgi:uncharacterized protein (TIGR03067 family)
MSRISFALLAVMALTAFAPAPLPRRDARIRDSLSVKDLLGVWRATELYNTPNKALLDPAANGVGHVTISDAKWVFGRQNGTTYDLKIDPSKNPAEIDFMYVGQQDPYGRGIIRRQGNTIRVIYNWGNQRPTAFENQQGSYWDLTLVKE